MFGAEVEPAQSTTLSKHIENPFALANQTIGQQINKEVLSNGKKEFEMQQAEKKQQNITFAPPWAEPLKGTTNPIGDMARNQALADVDRILNVKKKKCRLDRNFRRLSYKLLYFTC